MKEWYPIVIVVDIPNGTTTFTKINENLKTFEFEYEFESIILRSEANTLANILVEIDGKIYPCETYLIDDSNNFEQKPNSVYSKVYFATNIEPKKYPFKLKTKKGFKMAIYGTNTHTEAQEILILFNGYKIIKEKDDEILNEPINT